MIRSGTHETLYDVLEREAIPEVFGREDQDVSRDLV